MAELEFDDLMVRRRFEDGRVEQVAWAELIEVRVVTTANEPFEEDAYVVLIGSAGNGCVVPKSTLDTAFLARLQALPGFDSGRVVEAMSSMIDRQFLCWHK